MIILYGISNCDTIRKARRWLQEAHIDFHFHDYRKEGLDEDKLRHWVDLMGWEQLINKRGTTWRKLPEEKKAAMTKENAIQAILEQPAIIKRPLLDLGDKPILGFDETLYKSTFSKRTL